jgi:hypothetical protein
MIDPMNETENKTPDSSELSEIKSQCSALNRQVVMLLVALFMVSGTITVFVGIQSRRMGNDLKAVRPQARQIMEAAAKEQPVINRFMSQLADYGKAHPDFAPIMAKYRLATNAPAAGSITDVPPALGTPGK